MAIVVKTPAKVISKKLFGGTVALFELLPVKRLPTYNAGQFLHLATDSYDPAGEWPQSRVFSICNGPGAEVIKVLVSAKGTFTNRLVNEMHANDIVWLKLPYGEFTFSNTNTEIVLIAGGTGIAPYISFLEQCVSDGRNPSITLYYGVRSAEVLIFDEVLLQVQKQIPGLKVEIYIENSNFGENHKGVLSIAEIVAKHTQGDELFYLSGPEIMIKTFRLAMESKGIIASRIVVDDWN
jgi:Na+-transporting NADH:ubiquinone oxidoreductase subunit F